MSDKETQEFLRPLRKLARKDKSFWRAASEAASEHHFTLISASAATRKEHKEKENEPEASRK